MAIAAFVGAIIAYIGWVLYLKASVKPRSTVTSMPSEQIRSLFEDKVARLGWKIVDWDSPMVAQSPLLAGRRQQIALVLGSANGQTTVQVAPVRVWTKGLIGIPYKAHTLRMRMKSFISAVDAGAQPSTVSASGPSRGTTFRAPSSQSEAIGAAHGTRSTPVPVPVPAGVRDARPPVPESAPTSPPHAQPPASSISGPATVTNDVTPAWLQHVTSNDAEHLHDGGQQGRATEPGAASDRPWWSQ